MTILNILIGLLGLGIVVFVHELGHLLAAKSVGIEVETFSLGWGRRLAGFRWRGTEYQVSVFPVGGFCKMKGERSYVDALENDKSAIEPEEGSFYGASPWRRIVTLLAGPVANLIFAILVLSVIWWFGFEEASFENRIVVAADFTELADPGPAAGAGLETGDRVVAINGRETATWNDLQRTIGQNALTELSVEVVRDGQRLQIGMTPQLVPETGAGFIGIYPWIEPVVEAVVAESPASEMGLTAGDRIVETNGTAVTHVWEFRDALAGAPEPSTIIVNRGGAIRTLQTEASLEALAGSIQFQTILVPTPDYNIFQAIGRGTAEGLQTLATAVRSLRLLFQGVQLRNAVAGPARITYFIGEVATSGFSVGLSTGLRSLFNFLAFLSIVLFFMNLLPIPVLDGGQILLAIVEWLRGRMPHPKVIYRYQLLGSVMVFAILFFAIFGDILFFAGR